MNFFSVSSSSYRKCLGTTFSLHKHLECWVQSSHKAHTCSLENRHLRESYALLQVSWVLSAHHPTGHLRDQRKAKEHTCTEYLVPKIHITSKIIWLKKSSLAESWIHLSEWTAFLFLTPPSLLFCSLFNYVSIEYCWLKIPLWTGIESKRAIGITNSFLGSCIWF